MVLLKHIIYALFLVSPNTDTPTYIITTSGGVRGRVRMLVDKFKQITVFKSDGPNCNNIFGLHSFPERLFGTQINGQQKLSLSHNLTPKQCSPTPLLASSLPPLDWTYLIFSAFVKTKNPRLLHYTGKCFQITCLVIKKHQ